jgi:hypothetical protein
MAAPMELTIRGKPAVVLDQHRIWIMHRFKRWRLPWLGIRHAPEAPLRGDTSRVSSRSDSLGAGASAAVTLSPDGRSKCQLQE